MKPHELIKELVDRAGGSLPVAKAMKAPGFQPTLHKFISGHVESPTRGTAERIARHFGLPVDALYDEKQAALAARERGLSVPGMHRSPSQSDTTGSGLDRGQENGSTEAHVASHSQLQHTHTGAAVGDGQPPVSFDAVFAKMRPAEQKRLLFMFAAAFDDPPDPTGHIGGMPQWDRSTSAPGASPGRTKPVKKAPSKEKHRRLG